MNITINDQLITSKSHIFSHPYYKFKGQKRDSLFFNIPTLQRRYVWGEKDKIDSINELLEDLETHSNSKKSSKNLDTYFAGAVLLENSGNEFLNVIDGQQRITTLYLFNYLGYLMSKFLLNNIENTAVQGNQASQLKLFQVQNDRFAKFVEFERSCFILKPNNVTNYNKLTNISSFDEVTGVNGKENKYWKKRIKQSRLVYDDTVIKKEYDLFIQSTNLYYDENEEIVLLRSSSKSSSYYNALATILDYFSGDRNFDSVKKLNKSLENYLIRIDEILNNCGFAALISENKDDSFRLYEILNSRGHDLSSLDMIKNLILEKCSKSKPKKITIKDFDSRWDSLKKNVSATASKNADTAFVRNIIQTEGRALRTKEISYFANSKTTNREPFFVKESVTDFFVRLERASEIFLAIFNNRTNYKTGNSPYVDSHFSAYQNVTFMGMINFGWGPKSFIGANILYLESSFYKDSLNNSSKLDWKKSSTTNNVITLPHFLRFYSDILLKIGLVGIVSGKATGDLPVWSRELTTMIIAHTQKSNFDDDTNLRKLMSDIIGYVTANVFTKVNVDQFADVLGTTFRAKTGQKRNIAKILLYFIYNQGSAVMKMSFPELEHLEPANPIKGTKSYFDLSLASRDGLVNTLGNFALIEKKINIVDFSNKPLLEKVKESQSNKSLKSMALFGSELWSHLDPSKKISKSIYTGLFQMKKKGKGCHFDSNGAPTEFFFHDRSAFLAGLSKEIVCNSSYFLHSAIAKNDPYL